jgi:hypothetical protein
MSIMNITTDEAQQALEAIQKVMTKTRRTISSSGAYQFLLVWGVIWFIGFLSSQFIHSQLAAYIWMGLDILGGALSAFIGIRLGRYVRTGTGPSGKRIGLFWLLLFLFCVAAILVVGPGDWKQLAMLIILFVMIGWVAMSLLLSFASVKLGLVMTALSLIGYFLLPDYFFLWMAILGGGGMIAFGLYIRYRW